jgi:predicted dehydrogenase
MARPIRVALLGYGLGGRAFHAPLIEATDGLSLAAIVSANAERKAAAAREHPKARLLDSAEEVWRNRGDYDLVVISTPNRFHAPLALAALSAGIAVVIDKPMATSAAEARRLLEASRRATVPLTVYQNRRWDGDFLTMQRLIAAGTLGQVFRFESRFDRWRPAAQEVWRERSAPEEAGGLLFDLGSHLIDQALRLFGPVKQVYAEVDRRRPGVVVDDDFFIALTHESGVRSHLWATAVAAQPALRMRALGTRGAYTKAHVDVQEEWLRSGRSPKEPGYGEDPPEHWGLLGVGADARPVRTERGDYPRFYEQCVPWLREGAPPPVDPQDSVTVLEIIETARVIATGAAG